MSVDSYDSFDITKPPPAKDVEEVGEWCYTLYDLSRQWRDDELNMPDVWRSNHQLYRGHHWGQGRGKNKLTIGLFFSNLQRTVANIVSKNPVAEIIDLDGDEVQYAKTATQRQKKWWLETQQQGKLRTSTLNGEIYGITWEKCVWSVKSQEPGIIVCDPYAIFPYPGYYEDIARDCPAICHATAEEPSVIQQKYGTTEDIETSETYSLLGGEREEVTGKSTYGFSQSTSPTQPGYATEAIRSRGMGVKGEKGLVIEVWFRDNNTEQYPGGLRCVTICNEGKLVLSDTRNPNMNWAFPLDILEQNHLFRRFPFYKNNSYSDTTSIFGFSAAEQTGLLNIKIDELFSRLTDYAMRALTGILLIPQTAKIPQNAVDSKPGLILRPKTESSSAQIRFVPLPNPPSALFQILDMLIKMHDRVHALEDVDRGQTPGQVTAASAIVALQERNAALIQYKIDATDAMVASRGRCWVALEQMHGHEETLIEVDGEATPYQGDRMAGMNFDYIVESASTIAKTSLQLEEQAVSLADGGWIDQEALLDSLNFPDASQIIERMAEDQLGQAMEILIQAGMPEDYAQQVMMVLSEAQGGTGRDKQKNPPAMPSVPQPGVPAAQQGQQGGQTP